jgi:3-hydroxyphenylacetate 6-hydroxylase
MALIDLLELLQARTISKPIQTFSLGALLVFFSYVLINEYVRYEARVKKLGGPPGFPLIGNLWQIRTNAAEQYRHWSRKYGAVYQIQLGNVPIIVVNTAAAAKGIFGGHSQALSSRPEFYTFHKVRLMRKMTSLSSYFSPDSLQYGRNDYWYFPL